MLSAVCANLDGLEGVDSRFGGGRVERESGAFVGERYLRAGHNRSGGIGNCPDSV
jgi:hypothetical protein